MVRYADLHGGKVSGSNTTAPHLDNYYEPSEFIRIGEPFLTVGFMGRIIYLAKKYIDFFFFTSKNGCKIT